MATTDGETPIADIAIGDLVLAYDEATGMTGTYTVTAVLVHTDPVLIDLTIDGEQIETTPEHPFFTQERGWTNAGDVQPGAHVRKADGSVGVVQADVVVHRAQVMYNLTVAVAHTFFVGEGRWLVHNSGCNDFYQALPNGAAIDASLDTDGVLWTAIEVPRALRNQGVGKQLFGEAWNALGDRATAVGGKWNTSLPDNLDSFNANVRSGMSFEDAARNTFTGKQAADRGFTNVQFVRRQGTYGSYTNVEVIFK